MKKNWIIGGSLFISGLLLLIVPDFCVKLIVILFGIGTVAEGIYGITNERHIFDDEMFQKTILYKSIGNIIIGVLTVIMPLAIAGIAWAVMTYVLAIYLIMAAAAGFFASSKLKGSGIDRKQITIENLFVLAAGILLIIIGPENLAKVILRVIGIVAVLAGGIYIFVLFRSNKNNIVIADADVTDEE